MPVAILDFGTNTFNLLIAEKQGSSFRRLYSGKQGVKLGRGGIHKRTIQADAMERAYKAISNHMETIRNYGAEEIHAYATSAIRNAENGPEFAKEISHRFGFELNIIPGDREAELIYKGIMASVDPGEEKAMIMDIGGGSNEFIICDREKMYWKHSFELGMARILEKFKLSDPITTGEVRQIESYFEEELQPLFRQAEIHRPTLLIGASGSFDTIAAMLRHRLGVVQENDQAMQIRREDYAGIHHILLASTLEERRKMPGMEEVRLEMIVPATIFINFVFQRCGLTGICQSEYALKEGVMTELLSS